MGSEGKNSLRTSLIHFPVLALGPGVRVGLWTQGCSIRCRGCMSVHTWSFEGGRLISIKELSEKLSSYPSERLTISGGEPLDQYEALTKLLLLVRDRFEDILLYTGYEYKEVKERFPKILRLVDVLVAGPYMKGFPSKSRLKGSENQKVVFLNKKLKNLYEEYERSEPVLQRIVEKDYTIYIGIPAGI